MSNGRLCKTWGMSFLSFRLARETHVLEQQLEKKNTRNIVYFVNFYLSSKLKLIIIDRFKNLQCDLCHPDKVNHSQNITETWREQNNGISTC